MFEASFFLMQLARFFTARRLLTFARDGDIERRIWYVFATLLVVSLKLPQVPADPGGAHDSLISRVYRSAKELLE